MTDITALGARQQQALDWMLGKPIPEIPDSDLPLDEEWGMVVEDVDRVGPDAVRRITLRDEHVEHFLSECHDGARQLGDIASDWDDPVSRSMANALTLLAKRYEGRGA